MEDIAKRVADLGSAVDAAWSKLGLSQLEAEIAKLQSDMAKPDFWQDAPTAQETSKRQAELERHLQPWRQLKKSADELHELSALGDKSMSAEISQQLIAAEAALAAQQKELRFDGPYDDHGVILSIYAGAGGTDAQDWAQMLLRMYSRWAESRKFEVRSLEQTAGEEAGLKSATLEIGGGSHLFGRLAGEKGVHRLVRLSPFNADHKRQTSFAKVDVLPMIDKPSEVQLDDKDLKIDVYRSGGAGGQSVNTTDSAVRVTHLPTGLTVAIQNERSQQQNKETALAVLRSRLAALQLEQHAENLQDLKGPNQSAEWGSQIRSYVLHPYKQVKDLRTSYETANAQSVLDGNLDQLIDAWLDHKTV